MSITAITSLTSPYSTPVNYTYTAAASQNAFAQLLDEVRGVTSSDQASTLRGVSKIYKYFQDLGSSLQNGDLTGAQQALNSFEGDFLQAVQPSVLPTTAAAQKSSLAEPVLQTTLEPGIPIQTSTIAVAESVADQDEPRTMGVATGQSGWYKTVIQPLVDALPPEVSLTYQEAWNKASGVKDSAFYQSGSPAMGPGVYMYGMTPGGSLIGDWVANPYIDNSSSDLGNYTAGAGMFRGTDRTTIEQSILDSVAFNTANQAILNKYGYDLRAGDIRIGTGDSYTVYNPVTGNRASIDLKPQTPKQI